MQPKIIDAAERKLIGMCLEMSIINNKTRALFQQFMPRKKEISNQALEAVFALQQYDLLSFTPKTVFEKWACVEVDNYDLIPEGMEPLTLEAGNYAVFTHVGNVENFINTMQHILYVWLPNSGYELDNRPHFEILGSKYLGPENPNSEEEVWIPIK